MSMPCSGAIHNSMFMLIELRHGLAVDEHAKSHAKLSTQSPAR
jgi:hypothetical protein